jgi:hypothetical protein
MAKSSYWPGELKLLLNVTVVMKMAKAFFAWNAPAEDDGF